MGEVLSAMAQAASPLNLLILVIGTVCGFVVGALPGLSATTGVALVLPFTYALPADTSLILVLALYTAAEYANSIPAILISTPGTPGAIGVVFDGYPMAQRGEAKRALSISIVASAVGALISTVLLILVARPAVRVALEFGPAEYVAIGIVGLVLMASISGGSVLKTLVAGVFGLVLATVGLDVISGYPRFTFGTYHLLEGVPLVPALIGLLALPEVFEMIGSRARPGETRVSDRSALIRPREAFRLLPTMLRGSGIGFVIGLVPGAGATIASIVSYEQEKRWSKRSGEFGSGVPEGVAAPDAANNAVVGGSMVPLLTLGIPGSATAAIIYGALLMHDLVPGPELYTRSAPVVYSLYGGLLLAVLSMAVVGLLTIRVSARLVELPSAVLAPLIVCIGVVGSFAVHNSFFDVALAFTLGLLGHGMRRCDFPPAATVLGLVLGSIIEVNFQRAVMMGGGGMSLFLTRPICVGLLGLAAVSLVWSLRQAKRTMPA